MKTKATLIKEINRLTKFWYEYVSGDHHKDQDCHWSIEKRWSYGRKPYWLAFHWGYVFDGGEIRAKSYKKALKVLIGLLHRAVNEQKEWAKQVLEEPEEYNELQIKKAKAVKKFKP